MVGSLPFSSILTHEIIQYHNMMREIRASTHTQWEGTGFGQQELGATYAGLARRDALCAVRVLFGQFISQHRPNDIISMIDVGCGSGQSTSAMLNGIPGVCTGHPRGIVHAFDEDSDMVQRALANDELKPHLDSGRLTISVGNALQMLKPDQTPKGSVRLIGSIFVYHNFQQAERREFYEDSFAALGSGDYFVTADRYAFRDPVKHADGFAKERIKFDRLNADDPVEMEKWKAHNLLDETEGRKMYEDENLAAMEEVGYEIVSFIRPDPEIPLEAFLVARKP